MTKRLSLGGRLRIAAACPDANAPLFAEAADAIEQHEAYKQKVSDAAEEYNEAAAPMGWEGFERFIITKPDPLVEVAESLGYFNTAAQGWAGDVRASLEARGLEIRSKNDD